MDEEIYFGFIFGSRFASYLRLHKFFPGWQSGSKPPAKSSSEWQHTIPASTASLAGPFRPYSGNRRER